MSFGSTLYDLHGYRRTDAAGMEDPTWAQIIAAAAPGVYIPGASPVDQALNNIPFVGQAALQARGLMKGGMGLGAAAKATLLSQVDPLGGKRWGKAAPPMASMGRLASASKVLGPAGAVLGGWMTGTQVGQVPSLIWAKYMQPHKASEERIRKAIGYQPDYGPIKAKPTRLRSQYTPEERAKRKQNNEITNMKTSQRKGLADAVAKARKTYLEIGNMVSKMKSGRTTEEYDKDPLIAGALKTYNTLKAKLDQFDANGGF